MSKTGSEVYESIKLVNDTTHERLRKTISTQNAEQYLQGVRDGLLLAATLLERYADEHPQLHSLRYCAAQLRGKAKAETKV